MFFFKNIFSNKLRNKEMEMTRYSLWQDHRGKGVYGSGIKDAKLELLISDLDKIWVGQI